MSASLEDLLDHTRDTLIAGKLSGLADISLRVDETVANLTGLDRPAAERLRRKADRNARLLLAALRGVKAARQRLQEIGSGATLSTYDARGRREVITAPTTHIARRV